MASKRNDLINRIAAITLGLPDVNSVERTTEVLPEPELDDSIEFNKVRISNRVVDKQRFPNGVIRRDLLVTLDCFFEDKTDEQLTEFIDPLEQALETDSIIFGLAEGVEIQVLRDLLIKRTESVYSRIQIPVLVRYDETFTFSS